MDSSDIILIIIIINIMTHIVTSTFLTQLNKELNPQKIEVRDFHVVNAKDDHLIRQFKKHLITEKLHLGASTMVKFEVAKASNKKSVAPCQCHWKSGHSVFKFHYDLFKTESQYFLYLEAGVYLQKCRRHGRAATHVTLLDESNGSQVCREFINAVLAKVPHTRVENVEELDQALIP